MTKEIPLPDYLTNRIGNLVEEKITDDLNIADLNVQAIKEGRACACHSCTHTAVNEFNKVLNQKYADIPEVIEYGTIYIKDGKIVQAHDLGPDCEDI